MAIVLENSSKLATPPVAGVSSVADTLSFSPTSGRLLLMVGTSYLDSYTPNFSETHTQIFNSSRGGTGAGIYVGYAVSAGTETVTTHTISTDTRLNVATIEFSGFDATTPYDTVNNNEHQSATALGTVTATPGRDNGLAVVVFSGKNGWAWNADTTFSDGFTEVVDNIVGGNSSALSIATKAYTTAASMSCTVSTTDSGGQPNGAVMFFLYDDVPDTFPGGGHLMDF